METSVEPPFSAPLATTIPTLPECITVVGGPTNYRLFSQIVNGALTTLCVIFGTIGNLHSVRSVHITNLDKNRGVVLGVSVVALALWDTVLLVSAFFYYGMKHVTQTQDSDFQALITPWFHAVSQIANTASIWCVVAITLQRYFATKDPFRARRKGPAAALLATTSSPSSSLLATYRRHFRLPIILSLVALLVNLPAFFEIESQRCWRSAEQRAGWTIRISTLRRDRHYGFWYKMIFRMLTTSFGPNILILCFTLLTVYILRGSNRSRRNMFHMSDALIDRSTSRETMQTMIAFVLVTKFLLLRSLTFALDILEVTGEYHKSYAMEFLYTLDISNFLIILNSATNCLVFLRGGGWLKDRLVDRNTLKRKKTAQMMSAHAHKVDLLRETWASAVRRTNRQIGVHVLFAMLHAQPSLHDALQRTPRRLPRPVSRGQSELMSTASSSAQSRRSAWRNATAFSSSRSPVAAKRHAASFDALPDELGVQHLRRKTTVCAQPSLDSTTSGGGATGSSAAATGTTPNQLSLYNHIFMPSVSPLPSPMAPLAAPSRCSFSHYSHEDMVPADPTPPQGTPDRPSSVRHAHDPSASLRYYEAGERIVQLVDQLLAMMAAGQSEHRLAARLRDVGAVHAALGVPSFSAPVWRDFKRSMLQLIVTEWPEAADEDERKEAADAWSSLLSFIIREMKMGWMMEWPTLVSATLPSSMKQ